MPLNWCLGFLGRGRGNSPAKALLEIFVAILKLGQIETFPGFLDQRDASKGVNYWPKTSGSLEVCTVLVASCAA